MQQHIGNNPGISAKNDPKRKSIGGQLFMDNFINDFTYFCHTSVVIWWRISSFTWTASIAFPTAVAVRTTDILAKTCSTSACTMTIIATDLSPFTWMQKQELIWAIHFWKWNREWSTSDNIIGPNSGFCISHTALCSVYTVQGPFVLNIPNRIANLSLLLKKTPSFNFHNWICLLYTSPSPRD